MTTETLVYNVENFYELKEACWCGAIDRLNQAEKKGVESQVIECINNCLIIEENVTMTQLNDYIWFDDLENDLKEYYNIDLWSDNDEDMED